MLCVNVIEFNERPPSQQRPLLGARLCHSLCGGLVDASGPSWGQPRDPDFSPYATLQNPRSVPHIHTFVFLVSSGGVQNEQTI